MTYEDHFSGHAEAYARHRPRYPEAIYSWLASLTPRHELAWDAGCGNGQVAGSLAHHYREVHASDASGDQLSNALPHPRVHYHEEPSHRTTLARASVDLVAAGAAAHWFELEGFYREAVRVGREDAIIALWSYGPRDIADAVDPVVHRFQEEILRDYWPERIQYVHDQYRTMPFPFEDIAAPPFEMSAEWTLDEFLGFLSTWSASQKYLADQGSHPLALIDDELAAAWGDSHAPRRITWPLFFRVGRVSSYRP
jgi:SAM-dependent methyltransferase